MKRSLALLQLLLASSAFAIDVPRVGHSAVLLSDGRVLLVGGMTSDGGLTATTEIIDPASHVIASGPLGLVGSLAEPRWNAMAMNVPGRGVLLVGGQTPTGPTATIERFDEATGQWVFDSMAAEGRLNACWAGRADAEIWIAGGRTGVGGATASAVALQPWATTSGTTVNLGVEACGAVGLQTNQVLFTGGRQPNGSVSNASDLVLTGQFQLTPTGPLPRARWGHTLTLLRDGGVLLLGGWEAAGMPALNFVQFDPAAQSWRDAGTTRAFVEQVSLLMPDDSIAIIESPDAGNWPRITRRTPSGSLNNAGSSQMAGNASSWLLLHSGHLYSSGGHSDAGVLAWTTSQSLGLPRLSGAGPSLLQPRAGLVATLLPDRRVLAAGGTNAQVELLPRRGGPWVDGGTLLAAREGATATVLLSGEVLIAGGGTGTALASVERYQPATGDSRAVSSMRVARAGHAATLLPDGRVLVSGGSGLSSSELYDPQTDTWSDGPALPFSGPGIATVLMVDGRVFLQRNTTSVAWEPRDGGLTALPALGRNVSFAHAGLSASGAVYLVGGMEPLGGRPAEMNVYNPRRYTSTGWSSASSYLQGSDPLFIGFDNGQIAAFGGRATDAGLAAVVGVSLDLESYYVTQLNTAEGHAEGAAVWLPEGDALIVGGRTAPGTPTSGTERLEPMMFAPLASRPLLQPVGDVAQGQVVRVRGTGFVVPGGGGLRTMDDRVPVVSLRRMDNGAIRMMPSRLVSTTELEFTVPPDFPLGHAWLTVTVRAVPAVAVSVRVARALGAPCIEGSICASWVCTAGFCSAPVEMDAGVNDAGVNDGGVPDAGDVNDAGSSDAGAIDGGVDGVIRLPYVATVGCACSTSSAFAPWVILVGCWSMRRRGHKLTRNAW